MLTDRIDWLIERLETAYPDAACALSHRSPLELLVATILSAQCTDVRVNSVTRDLFKKYRTAADFAGANPDVFANEIRSTGFFQNKTKHILACARQLVDIHDGKVPCTMEELIALPGVGRKTANVVLGNAFGIATGIVVDRHVTRLAYRLGLSDQTAAANIERDLMNIVPKVAWIQFSHLLILHGRTRCKARKPDCPVCELGTLCPKRMRT